MSAYSLAHVCDVAGWPTVWGLQPEHFVEDENVRLRSQVAVLNRELLTISKRLKRLGIEEQAAGGVAS